MHSDRRHLERLSYSLHDAVLGSSPPKAGGACYVCVFSQQPGRTL